MANGRILREKIFDRLWIQPAAGDAGGALGAALAAWHSKPRRERRTANDSMRGALLGPDYSDDEIEAALKGHHAVYRALFRRRIAGFHGQDCCEMRKWWAGSRDGWNLARARWAIARFSATPVRRGCNR